MIDDDHEVVRTLEEAGFAVLQATWATHSREPGPGLAPAPRRRRADLTKRT